MSPKSPDSCLVRLNFSVSEEREVMDRRFFEIWWSCPARPGICYGITLIPEAGYGPDCGCRSSQNPDRDLSAWGDGQPQHRGPLRRECLLRPAAEYIAVPRPGNEKQPNNPALVDLDGFFGLNPALSAFKPIYDAGQLAIVHAVGSPDTTRSHFDAPGLSEAGTPG